MCAFWTVGVYPLALIAAAACINLVPGCPCVVLLHCVSAASLTPNGLLLPTSDGMLQATPLLPELLRRALELVLGCPCSYAKGCPRCVQHLDCKNYNAVLSKQGAVAVLRAALEQEEGLMQRTQQQQQGGNSA